MNIQPLTLLLVAAAVVYLMMYVGVGKRALDWKRATRICPSCGRATDQCRCHS